jgi:hypothetical protein
MLHVSTVLMFTLLFVHCTITLYIDASVAADVHFTDVHVTVVHCTITLYLVASVAGGFLSVRL